MKQLIRILLVTKDVYSEQVEVLKEIELPTMETDDGTVDRYLTLLKSLPQRSS